MKDKEKLEELLGSVKVPFSEYKDTYNKMLNSRRLLVDMTEDSQESTIIENAIMGAAKKGILTVEDAFILIATSTMALLSYGNILCIAYDDKKKGECLAGGFAERIRI